MQLQLPIHPQIIFSQFLLEPEENKPKHMSPIFFNGK